MTAGVTAADSDQFYPVEVVETGETGWVRDLAIDPRSFTPSADLPVVEVETPIEEQPAGEDESSSRGRRNREAPEAEIDDTGQRLAVEEPAADPGYSLENPAPAGAVLRVEGLAVGVNEAVFLNEVGFITPKGGYKFLAVSVRLVNRGTEVRTYSSLDFSAQDAVTGAEFDSVTVLAEDELTDGTLSPEEFVNGSVYFEVQETTQQALVKFDPNMFITDDDLYWRVP